MRIVFYPENCDPPMRPPAELWFDTIQVIAGVNNILDEKFPNLEKHPDYERYVERGAIVQLTEGEEVMPQTNTEITDLRKYAIAKALTLITATVDKDLLESWLKLETRAGVRSALNVRIDQLSVGLG